MHEVISRVEPSDSSILLGGFIVLSLLLTVSSIGFAIGIFLEMETMVLGVLLALSFASLGGMVLAVHRLFYPHRIVLEHDEELW
ncbi:hypothetical protein [Halodesulfurarchaeum sp.]|uniref:hypothetical protein n=1 Tax=Halodesulfurarchaeum sp. TaxID=1980530 RepID=UPI002FC29F5B